MRVFRSLLLIVAAAAMLSAATRVAAEAESGFKSLEQLDIPNGFRILLGEPARPALLTEALLVVRAGTNTPNSHHAEIAYVAAEALTVGSHAAGTMPVRLELARLGVTVDFTVGREVAVFRFAVPGRNTISFLHVLANLLDRRALPEDVWEEAIARRHDRLMQERSDPWQQATSLLASLIWRSPEEHADLSLSTLTTFWQRTYTPGNMILSVWGELPAAELKPAILHEFGRLGSGPGNEFAVPHEELVRNGAGAMRCLKEGDVGTAALLVGIGTEVDSDRTFYAWQLAVHILGASYNSRLQQRLRTETQVVYTVEAAAIPVGTHGMTLRITCQTDQVEATRRIILEELRRLTAEPVTQRELDFARAILRSRLKLDGISFRDRLYRRSLTLLSLDGVRDPSGAEPILDSFTPRTLLEALSGALKLEEASTVIVSTQSEAICGGNHAEKP